MGPLERSRFVGTVARRLSAVDEMFVIKGDGLQLFLLRDFVSDAECEALIEVIERDRFPSTVLGSDPDRSFRSSDSSALGYSGHPVARDIDLRLSALLGIDPIYGEAMEAQRYAEGQQFKPHYDYFHVGEAYWPEQDKVGGQRTWTAMICLGAPEDGGGTMFPEAGVRMRPRRGNLLAWCNLDHAGHVNPASLHCGEPVGRGRKYIITKWYRERVTPRVAFAPAEPVPLIYDSPTLCELTATAEHARMAVRA